MPTSPWYAFDLAVAAWVLDPKRLDHVVAGAIDALVAGADTPSLRILAGLEGEGWSEIEPATRRVLRDRGLELTSREAAFKTILDDWMQAVLAGERTIDAWLLYLDGVLWSGLPSSLEDEMRDAFFHPVEYRFEIPGVLYATRADLESEVLARCREIQDRGGLVLDASA